MLLLKIVFRSSILRLIIILLKLEVIYLTLNYIGLISFEISRITILQGQRGCNIHPKLLAISRRRHGTGSPAKNMWHYGTIEK